MEAKGREFFISLGEEINSVVIHLAIYLFIYLSICPSKYMSLQDNVETVNN